MSINKKHHHQSSMHKTMLDVDTNNGDDVIQQDKEMRRRAQKLARKLATDLGLDENGQPLDVGNFSLLDYPVREYKFGGPIHGVAINPIVTFIGILGSWGVVLWSAVDPTGSLETMLAWRGNVSLTTTWLFQGSKALFFFFMMYIAIRYGHIRLGRKGEKPDFSTPTYFCMIFAAGVAVGLFVYGVAEPLYHQQSHFFAQSGYRSQDEIDMFAINMSVTNWGITGWTPYLVVAVAMSLAGHCFNLPMTFRSCLYPVLGAYTWGWIGDLIDGMAIVVTIAGICTSLGLGAIQIVAGFIYLGWVDAEVVSTDRITTIQNTTIWFVTVISVASVLSGLHGGIKIMSFVALGLSSFMLFLVLALDDTKYLLNLQVQEVGYFLQYSVFELNFWTDSYGQLREGSGRAIDGKAAKQWWMDAWMVFYQAWWVAWSIFVGLFVAGISRGRRLWEVVVYCMFAPIGYCLVWFCVWGGIGLRQARQGLELASLGEKLYNNSGHFLVDGNEFCYDVPQEDIVVGDKVVFTNHLLGVTPVCQFDSDSASMAPFRVLHSFSFPDSMGGIGLGPSLSVLFIVSCAIYFVTSSDSATLVIDKLASNGRKNQHWTRQMFWAATIGALATTLLSSGGSDALSAVQAASILCALPILVIMFFMLQAISLFCQAATSKKHKKSAAYPYPIPQNDFSMPLYGGILNVVEFLVSGGHVNPARIERGMDKPTRMHIVEFVKGIVVPFVSLHQILNAMYRQKSKTNMTISTLYGVVYAAWIVLYLVCGHQPGVSAIVCTLMVFEGFVLGMVRSFFRFQYRRRSHVVGDLLGSILFWPQVLTQMQVECAVMLISPSADRDDNECVSTLDHDSKSYITL